MELFKNIRFYVLLTSALLAGAIYTWIKITIPNEPTAQIIKLTQAYALVAVTYLYIALLTTPITRIFTFLPFRGHYIKARRAIGVSAFLFSLLHASFAFFGELGGFHGLGFLGGKYLLAIGFSFTALVIFFLMAATSFDYMVSKFTYPRWKFLHRFVYVAGIFVIIHALLLGSHFTDLSAVIPQIFFAALVILVSLETIRFDRYLQLRFQSMPQFGVAFAIFLVITAVSVVIFYTPVSGGGTVSSFNIHAVHIQLAREAQQGASAFPGLQGDRTKRFTVSFTHPDIVTANQDVQLRFQVFDASSGFPVAFFNRIYEKALHLIIVDSELHYFNHIHPDLGNDGFVITTQFPKDGQYHLYVDFQPHGAVEQQFAFVLNVGTFDKPAFSKTEPDINLTKTFDAYQIALAFPIPLKATEMSIGNQKLTFTINDAKTKQPVTTLKPYLAAFGHLVIINQETFDYLHVHPSNIVAPKPDEDGGSKVEFLPLGLYGPIKPGVYRVFAQFNPDNHLFTSDFTVKVE